MIQFKQDNGTTEIAYQGDQMVGTIVSSVLSVFATIYKNQPGQCDSKHFSSTDDAQRWIVSMMAERE